MSPAAGEPAVGVMPGVDGDAAPDVPDPTTSSRATWSARLALAVFAAYLAAGWAYILLGPATQRWFWADEWAFLTVRGSDLADYFTNHAGHWVTVPMLIQRGLFSVVGVSSYLPYLIANLVAHTAVVVLLRVLLRRNGAGPWTATLVASVLMLLGGSEYDILFAFQMAFTLSMAFGLGQLVASDHDGRWGWRDALSMLLGLLALMSSAVGLCMVVVAAVYLAMRRGWRIALLHGGVLIGIFMVWRTLFGGETLNLAKAPILSWVTTALVGTGDALSGYPWLGAVLGVVVVAGLVVRYLDAPAGHRIARMALPAALISGWLLLLALLWQSRSWQGVNSVANERYLYVHVALLLPVVGLALAALIRRWRVAAVALAIPVLALVLNAQSFGYRTLYPAAEIATTRQHIVDVAAAPGLAALPDDARIVPVVLQAPVSAGWIRAQAAAGTLPDQAPDQSQAGRDWTDLALGLSQTDPAGGGVRGTCRTAEQFVVRTAPGRAWWFDGRQVVSFMEGFMVTVESLDPAGRTIAQNSYGTVDGHWLRSEGPGGLRLRLTAERGGPFTLCPNA